MFKYSKDSLKKYPWLWKYDKRFKRSCLKRGHRFHWNKVFQTSTYLISVGLCIYCAIPCQAAIHCDTQSRTLKVVRVIDSPQLIELNKENVSELFEFIDAKGLNKE